MSLVVTVDGEYDQDQNTRPYLHYFGSTFSGVLFDLHECHDDEDVYWQYMSVMHFLRVSKSHTVTDIMLREHPHKSLDKGFMRTTMVSWGWLSLNAVYFF